MNGDKIFRGKFLNCSLIIIAIVAAVLFVSMSEVTASADNGMLCGTVSDLEKIFKTNETIISDKPPIDYIISKANYDLSVIGIHTDYAGVKASYDIEILTEKWIKIKLINGEFAIRDAKLDGKDISLIAEQGSYHLILNNQKGKHKLEINSLIRIKKDTGNTKYIKFGDIPETSISTVRIGIQEINISVEIEGSFGTEIEESFWQNKTIVTAILRSGKGIGITWYPKREKIIEKEKLPVKLYADVNSLVSIGEGVMECYTSIDYSIPQGSTNQFRIQIPESVNVLDVRDIYGNPIKEYNIDNKNILLIRVPYEISDSYKIILKYEKDMNKTSVISDIPEINALDVEREKGYIGISAKTNVEINIINSSDVQRVDVQELPQSVWKQSRTPLLFGYKYLKHPYSITIDIKKHEDIPVLVAAIDYAKIVTLLTDDRKGLTKATYYIKNNRKQFLEVTLPEGSEMWSAFVSDAPVKPAKNEYGKILIPLSRSSEYEGSLYTFSVEFVYISNISKFGYFGTNNYEIPVVDIPISQINLLLYLPDDYDFIKFEGSMKRTDYFEEYIQGAIPKAMVPTSPSQVSNVMIYKENDETKASGGANRNAPVQDQYNFQAELQEATEKGVLPVRINIPQNGKAYYFTKLLIVEYKKLNVDATYIDSEIYKLAGIIVLLFILVPGFYVVRNIRKLKNKNNLIKILFIIVVPLIISYFLIRVWNYAVIGWAILVIGAVIYRIYLLIKEEHVIGKKNTNVEEKNENVEENNKNKK